MVRMMMMMMIMMMMSAVMMVSVGLFFCYSPTLRINNIQSPKDDKLVISY